MKKYPANYSHSNHNFVIQNLKGGRIIRGDEKGNYYPAKKFFEELIPKHLSEYQFIQQLIIPEIPINEITQVDVDEYANQHVDFYLPQAYLIIEINGSRHVNSASTIIQMIFIYECLPNSKKNKKSNEKFVNYYPYVDSNYQLFAN